MVSYRPSYLYIRKRLRGRHTGQHSGKIIKKKPIPLSPEQLFTSSRLFTDIRIYHIHIYIYIHIIYILQRFLYWTEKPIYSPFSVAVVVGFLCLIHECYSRRQELFVCRRDWEGYRGVWREERGGGLFLRGLYIYLCPTRATLNAYSMQIPSSLPSAFYVYIYIDIHNMYVWYTHTPPHIHWLPASNRSAEIHLPIHQPSSFSATRAPRIRYILYMVSCYGAAERRSYVYRPKQ